MLFTCMGLDVDLPGLKIKAKTQLNVIINDKMFSAGVGFNFDLETDIPPKYTAGVLLGDKNSISINLDISMTLQILYNQGGWVKDRLIYKVAVSTTRRLSLSWY